MTTWLLPIASAILAAAASGIGTWYTMKLNAAKERSDRDSQHARTMRDALQQAERSILADENAHMRELLQPIKDQVAFLHNVTLRARIHADLESAIDWRLIRRHAHWEEVVPAYLGDAITALEAAVRGDRLPMQSHEAAWFDMIRDNVLPSPEQVAAMVELGSQEHAFQKFCEEREKSQRRLRLPFRRSTD